MSYEMETYVSVQAACLPDDYLRLLAQRHGQVFERDDPVDDVMVRVTYIPGWYQSGNRNGHPDNWTPDEGEDPEVETLTLLEDDWEMKWDPTLPREFWDKLVEKCCEDQRRQEAYDEPDY